MTRLEEIEKAITTLSQEQLAQLRDWLEDYEAELWEAEFALQEDFASDFDTDQQKLNAIAEQAIAEFRKLG